MSLDTQKLLTISDWIVLQARGGGLDRLVALVASQDTTDPAWISLATIKQIEDQFVVLQELEARGHSLPLYGVPFAVKDNIDVKTFITTTACPDFAYEAKEDAAVVEILKKAGAIVIGKTNLDQFATGLVGTRSPYGVVPNTFNKDYISGGSSSGSASVVARGIVPFALGTDTAGSGRVPAGLNNIVGLKPTRGYLSTRGVVPACRSLDCVSILALTVEDSQLILQISGIYDEKDPFSRPVLSRSSPHFDATPLSTPPPNPRIAICEFPEWFGDTGQASAYTAALATCREIGWDLVPVDFSLLFKLGDLLYEGPWVVERYAAIKDFIEKPGITMDPTVRAIIEKAKGFSSVDVFEAEHLRQDLTRQIERQFQKFDAILVPTTPTFPTIQQVVDEPILHNSRLGLYTSFVNFLDWCALAFPADFRSDGLPFGLTLISTQWEDLKLLKLSKTFLDRLELPLVATGSKSQVSRNPSTDTELTTLLAVVGAHLSGLPLNYQLTDLNATLSHESSTSAHYNLHVIKENPGSKLLRPALTRVPTASTSGRAIKIEIWNLPTKSLSKFARSIAQPLSIGAIELQDGSWVRGFVSESRDPELFRLDITGFGGWRAWLASNLTNSPTESDVAPKLPEVKKLKPLPLFNKILIANRGEIAVRIASTLRKLSIHSVGIYAHSDRESMHVHACSTSFPLEGNTLAETYLSQTQILDIAKECNADAIIPGYGFLAENADFAQRCEEEGLVWVGPSPEQMRMLGLKDRAREVAERAGVPLLPGTGLLRSVEQALGEGERIGYPLMVKSAAGGGGIGLQKCRSEEELKGAFEIVRRQGESYFKNDGVFLERFVENARHIEVQIIGNGEGEVRSIGTRDCSLQRRHQKVVEECPAWIVPPAVAQAMCDAAVRLAESLNYRNVGTVEFIYDPSSEAFYFLEVNTRLQVEHTVTEEVFGCDLVEEMLRVAAKAKSELFSQSKENTIAATGHAIEVRIYAESPLRDFRPATGQSLSVKWPENVRLDTWIKPGTQISASYDPLLAKLIVLGSNRSNAIEKLKAALSTTEITGIETNLEYLRHISKSTFFGSGKFTTTSLDSFDFRPNAIQVLDPGSSCTIQDFAGRTGLWHVGIPPSGPMDDFSFRLANRILGNDPQDAGLECTSTGPTLLFHSATTIAIVGPTANHRLDDTLVETSIPISINPGQVLTLATPVEGFRTYLAVQGGIQTPQTFGSRATFALGNLGGLRGDELRTNDILPLCEHKPLPENSFDVKNRAIPRLTYNKPWILRVIPGPHAFPDYFSEDDFAALFESTWKVHYNSNRIGVRLMGPRPVWARSDGGEAGLHPSNIHDSPYSVGSISFTGEEAVILTCDGPSLGGFLVFAVIAHAEMWKVGQMRPGDEVRLIPISVEQAMMLHDTMTESIESMTIKDDEILLPTIVNPVIGNIGCYGRKIVCRQAGDSALLLEFGDDKFDMRTSFHIQTLMKAVCSSPLKYPEVIELTPGVRSLHVLYDISIPPTQIISILTSLEQFLGPTLPSTLPSRVIRLPIVFEHSSTIAAVERYSNTIRSSAPWLPNNIDFLQKVNGLPSRDALTETVLSATFLVLGLGDVFFGAPCAVPLDPRHRLFGTKYSPPRSFTPEGTVGIGGQYLCIYGIDSPGGYQLIGRTVPIWDRFATPPGPEVSGGKNPWMFEIFDQLRFYVVSEAELDATRESGTGDRLVMIEEGELELVEYEKEMQRVGGEAKTVAAERMEKIKEAGLFAQLTETYRPQALTEKLTDMAIDLPHGVVVRSEVMGRCWKIGVAEGDEVETGQTLAMKMEINILAPVKGKVMRLDAVIGETLNVGDSVAIIGLP